MTTDKAMRGTSMADDGAPTESPTARKIKIRPDHRAVAIETDFSDNPDMTPQSWQWGDGMMSGFKTAEQVADWIDA